MANENELGTFRGSLTPPKRLGIGHELQMNTYYNPNGSFDLREQNDDAVSLTPEDVHVPVKDLEPAENPDTGKRFVDSAPDGCPRCGGKLDPSAYASWTCWNCRDRVRVVDQGGDER